VPSKSDRPTLDELAEAWQPERPTDQRTRRILQSEPPVSYPAPSTRTLQRDIGAWCRHHWWLFVLVGGGVPGVTVPPWRDLLGLASMQEVQDIRAVVENVRDASVELDAGLANVRDRVGKLETEQGDLKSQFIGLDERQESVEVKPKRRR
jgi:hypothetical protein